MHNATNKQEYFELFISHPYYHSEYFITKEGLDILLKIRENANVKQIRRVIFTFAIIRIYSKFNRLW